jgi:hypothetical protein
VVRGKSPGFFANTLAAVLNSRGVSEEQLNTLPDKIQELMARIRPHAVKLVDAWQIPDFLLDRYVSLGSF